MKLRFVWVGKTKHAALRELVEQYLERVGRFAGVELTEVKDRTDVGSDPRKIIEKEAEAILEVVAGDPCLVALDERGREFDSIRFAEFVEQHRVRGTRRMTFVVGGHLGFADAVRKRADLVMALSKMTLTHELARVLLLEQIYRAFTVIYDLPYQK